MRRTRATAVACSPPLASYEVLRRFGAASGSDIYSAAHQRIASLLAAGSFSPLSPCSAQWRPGIIACSG